MSTLFKTHNIDFSKKPSKAVLMRSIGKCLEQGAKSISLTWGENWIDLDYHPNQEQWYGQGWIKEIGGDDIAQELNTIRKQALADIQASRKFYNDHFQFVKVGF